MAPIYMQNHVHILCKISYATDLSPRLGVLDVSATREMYSVSPMLAIAEASGHFPMHALAEAGEWLHKKQNTNDHKYQPCTIQTQT